MEVIRGSVRAGTGPRTFLRMSNRGLLYRRLYKIPWYFEQRRGPRCTAGRPVLRSPGFEDFLEE